MEVSVELGHMGWNVLQEFESPRTLQDGAGG